MAALIKFTMPTDQKRISTVFEVSPGALTPKARAFAEALADPGRFGLAQIRLLSRVPARELYRPGGAELRYGAGSPKLDQPEGATFTSWWKIAPTPENILQVLEWEARKFPRYYPVALDGSPLPSSAAARDDDGLLRNQVFEVLGQYGPLDARTDADTWMRKATQGADGYPAPARHNGFYSLWSEADIRAWATAHAITR